MEERGVLQKNHPIGIPRKSVINGIRGKKGSDFPITSPPGVFQIKGTPKMTGIPFVISMGRRGDSNPHGFPHSTAFSTHSGRSWPMQVPTPSPPSRIPKKYLPHLYWLLSI